MNNLYLGNGEIVEISLTYILQPFNDILNDFTFMRVMIFFRDFCKHLVLLDQDWMCMIKYTYETSKICN